MTELTNTDDRRSFHRQPTQGAFPFRILETTEESIFLTWLRNHSSYLAAGGFVGTLSAIGVYVRGVFANLMILSLVFIPLGFLLGYVHYDLLMHPFYVSGFTLAVAIVSMLAFFAVRRGDPRDQVAIRSWMSVMPGLIVGFILLSIAVEISPQVIEFFRKQLPDTSFGLVECITLVFSLGATGGTIVNFLPKNKSVRQKLGLGVVALLGFGLLWFVVLRIANYVYYGVPPSHAWQLWSPMICLVLLLLCFLLAIWWRPDGGRTTRVCGSAAAVLIAMVLAVPCVLTTYFMQVQTDLAAEGLGEFSRPLSRVIRGLEQSDAVTQEKVFRLVEQKRELDNQGRALQRQDRQEFFDDSPAPNEPLGRGGVGLMLSTVSKLWDSFRETAKATWRYRSELTPEYYGNAQQFLEDVEQLKTEEISDIQVILDHLANSAFDQLAAKRNQEASDAARLNEKFIRAWIEAKIMSKLAGIDPDAILSRSEDELTTWMEATLSVTSLKSSYKKSFLKADNAKRIRKLVSNSIGNAANDLPTQNALPDVELASLIPFEMDGVDEFWRTTFVLQLAVRSNAPMNELLSLPIIAALPNEDLDKIRFLRAFSGSRFVEVVKSAVPQSDDLDRMGLLEHVENEVQKRFPRTGEDSPLSLTVPAPFEKASRELLIDFALDDSNPTREIAEYVLGELYDPHVPVPQSLQGDDKKSRADFANRIHSRRPGKDFSVDEYDQLLIAFLIPESRSSSDHLLRRMVHGRYGNFEELEHAGDEVFQYSIWPKLTLLSVFWISTLIFCYAFANPNLSSAHGFYRDRLANAFILTKGASGEAEPEIGVKLSQLCDVDNGNSTSPYHLINTALNINRSELERVRDRNADFFVFSKLYCGGDYVGYIPTKSLEAACPELTIASAMAVSAGAASPNMGKYTPGVLTFLLALLNVRLGQWIPNPKMLRNVKVVESQSANLAAVERFEHVFAAELPLLEKRRENCLDWRRGIDQCDVENSPPIKDTTSTVQRQLLGLALSGGGIRSASVSLGCTQALDRAGVLDWVDYLSTVSGGGYTGTAISSFMRQRFGTKTVDAPPTDVETKQLRSLHKEWRPPFGLFFLEMVRWVGTSRKWVNLSDGGHVENLGVYELLRRRCEIIIACDGEEDFVGAFPGLSTVKRLAEIDMNIKIEFPPHSLEMLCDRETNERGVTRVLPPEKHFAIAKITYPSRPELGQLDNETGYLLYIRSGLKGDEDQVIAGYKKSHPEFPHESIADQSFDEVQFEAYRRLGEKIMSTTLEALTEDGLSASKKKMENYGDLVEAIDTLTWRVNGTE
jgi:hypothetical protein